MTVSQNTPRFFSFEYFPTTVVHAPRFVRAFAIFSDWLHKHPGGSEVVLLMAGRDATEAFKSYHPFTDKPRKVTKTNMSHHDDGIFFSCCDHSTHLSGCRVYI